MRFFPRLFAAGLLSAGLAVVAPPAIAWAGNFDTQMMSAMAHMDAAMAKAPMTGNPDRDFIAMMIPHHQGAIDMAKSELIYGHDPRLIRLAQEIIVTQESEIAVMRLVGRSLPKTTHESKEKQ